MRRLMNLMRDRRGATAVEYGLILALIFIAMVAGVASLGRQTTSTWGNISNEFRKA